MSTADRQIEIPDFSLVVLIGATGSGKSTFAAKHFLTTEVISSDTCRALVADDETDQGVTADAFALVREIAGKRLKQSLGNLRSIAELRGIGLWFGIELMDRFGRPAAEGAREAARRLRDRGVVVGRGGYDDNVVKLSPPLMIEASQLMEALDQVSEVIHEIAA